VEQNYVCYAFEHEIIFENKISVCHSKAIKLQVNLNLNEFDLSHFQFE